MDDTGNRCAATVIDVGHGTGNCSGYRNTTEDRNNDIGCSLCDQFRIRIVFIARYTIGNGRWKKWFYSSQHGNGKSRRKQKIDRFHIERDRFRLREGGVDGKSVADRFYAGNTQVVTHDVYNNGHNDNGDQWTGYLFREPGRNRNNKDTDNSDYKRPDIDRIEMFEVSDPFGDKVSGYFFHRQSE